MSLELGPEDGFEGLGTREGSWVEATGGSCGMLVDERARWMAAAEGMVELGPAVLEPRLGLASLLLLREARVDLGCVSAGWVLRCEGRAGDELREDMGELAADCVPDRVSERAPLVDGWRMGAAALSAGVGAAEGVAAEGVGVGVGVGVALDVGVVLDEAGAEAGSAVSGEPVSERNESPRESVVSAMLACREAKLASATAK